MHESNLIIKLTDSEFADLSNLVRGKYGLDISTKKNLLEGRFSSILKAKGYKSFAPYIDLLKSESNSEELQFFLDKVTTHYSYFGREHDHFNYLMQKALPELKRTRGGVLRIWSAGCSSGQEAYNLAMVMEEFFGEQKSLWDTVILASDISTHMLAEARRGVYTVESIEKLPPEWITKYFRKLNERNYQVIDRIREEVVFRQANLMEPFEVKKPFDIIFCRNVMIYFDSPTSHKLINRFYDITAPGGYLFTGHSEFVDKNLVKYDLLQPAVLKRK